MSAKVLSEVLIYEVLSVVSEIPIGNVATYGQIAQLINRPKNARLVGKVLSQADFYGEYPCHRVVNAAGRLAPHFVQQKSLLLDEGITFKDACHVDIKQHKWTI
uniref:MGMT family protein n=1 Tax=Globicatella sulfidifaciens TaxID=136093 RepID=UPI0023F51833|nr:methylated-DNA--[protein]-cysteine S-methyltransferase [Globicatella sulfidifaciens]